MRKNQILTWVIVLLLISNTATIGTILYHNYRENQNANQIGINTGAEINMLNGRYFRQTLGFNEQQMESFRTINREFRPSAMEMTIEIDSLKNNMFAELQKATPDTIQLNEMSKQIGVLHGRLKYATYHFYLNIKNVCSAAQSIELEKIFMPLFKSEGLTAGPNHLRRRGAPRN
ncbi:MAG: hypothetical protein WAR78_03700 [Ferruginibacter sp.]